MTALRKKLIEVALPLEKINAASAREKSIRHGHPSTLHLWWARRPLAAARAVIFGQMVDDPSSWPELFPTEVAQEAERQRLFRLIEQLVQWENTTNEDLLQQARDEIWKSWHRTCADNKDHPRAAELFDPEKLPAFHDPFAGGGSLPLEAQRLGLEAYASDLNPVAVLINKAMIEIPPKFAGMPPVSLTAEGAEERRGSYRQNPLRTSASSAVETVWRGAAGLAEDVRYYGQWMRDEAEKRIGHLYPKIEVTAEMVRERPDLKPYLGKRLTVIAWLWARTVKSPNPAFAHVDVPLASTFMLSARPGKEAYVEPVITPHPSPPPPGEGARLLPPAGGGWEEGVNAVTRRDFVAALRAELPVALKAMQRGNIAPVDLAQAAIGPGMAVFTRYGKVIDASGKPLSVREALALINATLDEVLAEQEGDFDADTRWALAWFEQYGFDAGEYGVAETLSKAKNTSVGGMVEAGLLTSVRAKYACSSLRSFPRSGIQPPTAS